MNIFTAECCDRLANLTEEEFRDEETCRQIQNELNRMQSILSTVKEWILAKPETLLTLEDAAYIFEEDPIELRKLMEENQALLALDGWRDPYLTVRVLFRLATLLPKNPIAQECVCQLLNIALK